MNYTRRLEALENVLGDQPRELLVFSTRGSRHVGRIISFGDDRAEASLREQLVADGYTVAPRRAE